MHWYYAHDRQQDGPHSEEALQNLVKSGKVNASTLVWREGMPNWLPVSEAAPHFLVGQPAAVPPPLSTGVRCVECGGVFPASETVSVGGANVCARCKPLHLQKVQEGVATMGPRENVERLVRIAKGQRGVNMAILLTFAGYACLMMGGVVAPARRPGAGASAVAVFALVGGVTVLVAVVLQALYVYRLAGALDHTAIIWVLGVVFLGCIGLILLLVLSSQATKELRKAGIKVGLLGANPEDVERARLQ